MEHERFMKAAISAAEQSPFPFGAVLVKDGEILSTSASYSSQYDTTAHAEMKVIREAHELLHSRKLDGCTLYSTCEPCPMCFTAAWWAGIERIVFGITLAESSQLFLREIKVEASYLNERGGDKIELVGGVLREDILMLYRK